MGFALGVVLVSLLSNPGSPPLAPSEAAARVSGPSTRGGGSGASGITQGEPATPSAAALLEPGRPRRPLARAGIFTFALALGVLLLGGGRELLLPRRATVLVALAGAPLVYWLHTRAPILGLRVGMTVIAGVALLHAAQAAAARHAARAKWRLMLATCALVGTSGVALAAFAG